MLVSFFPGSRAMLETAPAAPAAAPRPLPPIAGKSLGAKPPPMAATNQACSTERPPGPESARRADPPDQTDTFPRECHQTNRIRRQANSLVDRADSNGDGAVSMDDFYNIMTKKTFA